MPKRKEAPRSTQQEIIALEKMSDACEKEMANIKRAASQLQAAWDDTLEKLEVLYRQRDRVKGAKRVRMSITGKICPVITRKVSFPTPPQ